jgi:hypothetical protein
MSWAAVKDGLIEALKSDPQRMKEWAQTLIDQTEQRKVLFVQKALAVGFTQQQANLMAEFMSFEGHQHAYLNNNYTPTISLERL